MSLYRYRLYAYAALVPVLVAAGFYQSAFTWEVVGPTLVLYLPTSLIICALARLWGSTLSSDACTGFDLLRRCWWFFVPLGLLLLATYPFLPGNYAAAAGLWTMLLALELYLVDAETAARAALRAVRTTDAPVEPVAVEIAQGS